MCKLKYVPIITGILILIPLFYLIIMFGSINKTKMNNNRIIEVAKKNNSAKNNSQEYKLLNINY